MKLTLYKLKALALMWMVKLPFQIWKLIIYWGITSSSTAFQLHQAREGVAKYMQRKNFHGNRNKWDEGERKYLMSPMQLILHLDKHTIIIDFWSWTSCCYNKMHFVKHMIFSFSFIIHLSISKLIILKYCTLNFKLDTARVLNRE